MDMTLFNTMSGAMLNIVIAVLGTAFIGGTLAGIFWYINFLLRYNIDCTIWFKDAFGKVHERKDKAGIYTERTTKLKRFWIKKANHDLDCDKVPIINDGRKKHVYLLQLGEKDYRYITPKVETPNKITFSIGEEDVNWALTTIERTQKSFFNTLLGQYIVPITIYSLVVVGIMVLVVSVVKILPEITANMAEVTKNLAQAKMGTVVMSG